MGDQASEQDLRILLFGLGAIGGFYAFILGRNENVSLTVVARSNYEHVKANGLKIESLNHGQHHVRFDHVLGTAADAKTSFDYIVCANKAVNQASIPIIFKPIVKDETTFVIIQNGVGNEEPFRKAFPHNTILSCVTWVHAIQDTPGVITHTKFEDTQIGLFPNQSVSLDVEKHRLDMFANLLSTGGTVVHVEDDIQIKRWEKVVWNAAWNPLTTLTDIDTQAWLKSSDEALAMTKQLMREVIDVAQRCDVPLKYDLVDQFLDTILAMPGLYSSMHTDAKAGRPLEVDVILGYPIKKAREFDMAVPTLRAVYALTIAVNGRLSMHAGARK